MRLFEPLCRGDPAGGLPTTAPNSGAAASSLLLPETGELPLAEDVQPSRLAVSSLSSQLSRLLASSAPDDRRGTSDWRALQQQKGRTYLNSDCQGRCTDKGQQSRLIASLSKQQATISDIGPTRSSEAHIWRCEEERASERRARAALRRRRRPSRSPAPRPGKGS